MATQDESERTTGLIDRALSHLRRMPIGWAVLPLFILDASCIFLSMRAAYRLRFQLLEYRAYLYPPFYTRLLVFGIPLWILIFALYRLYRPSDLFGGMQEYTQVVNGCTAGLMGLLFYSFLDRTINEDISRGWLAMVWFFSVASVGGARFTYRRLVYALREWGAFSRRTLIVGGNEEGRVVADQLASSPSAGLDVVGFVDPLIPADTEIDGLPVLGDLEGLGNLISGLGVRELIVIPTALDREALLNIYRHWGTNGKVRVRLSSGLYELLTTGVEVKEVGFIPLVSINRLRITGLDALLKIALDYVVAILGLLLLSPFFLIIAILIRLDSEGTVIYRRRVLGLQGCEFDAYKFRSMVADAEAYLDSHPRLKEEWEKSGKIKDDPRVTRIGRFLRRYSIDELPQLVNVIKGQMSLVGPRMITPEELRHFGHWQHNLLTVKPGLTGLWQTTGRADLSYEERVRLDMYYIRNYTIWLDLKLLFKTVWAVIKGKGAF